MRPYLRLVSTVDRLSASTAGSFEQLQVPLAPTSQPTIAICTSDALDAGLLETLIVTRAPTVLIDFRTTPRFDFGDLNRRKVLALLEESDSRYFDFGSDSIDELERSTEMVCSAVVSAKSGRPYSVIVLLDSRVEFERFGIAAVQKLRSRTVRDWELLLFGPVAAQFEERDLLFISHANPEDNEFVLWLQIQLTRLGYNTWSDLTDIRGGEHHWDTIEDTIRKRAVRVLAVVSKASLTKPGVLDEVSLAISVERSRQLKNFVVPLRVQDIPFGDFRANVARKNIIDFTNGWSLGLSLLAQSLSADSVPRQEAGIATSVTSWWIRNRQKSSSVVRTPELLRSNRFEVKEVPSLVYFYPFVPSHSQDRIVPFAKFGQKWASFMSPDDLEKAQITAVNAESIVSTDEMFPGSRDNSFRSTESSKQRAFHYLLNCHWNSFVIERGLHLYRETGRFPVPYFRDGLLPNNTVQFMDENGVMRRRIVVGCSVKRNMYWHLAPSCSFSTTDRTALDVRMRVVFSEDGQQRWLSSERMKRMRRAFCKNWWNDRWRSLQQAFVAWLAGTESVVRVLEVGSGSLVVSATPISYQCALSIDENRLINPDILELPLSSSESIDIDDWNVVDEVLEDEVSDESKS